jgi:hypothetical protein
MLSRQFAPSPWSRQRLSPLLNRVAIANSQVKVAVDAAATAVAGAEIHADFQTSFERFLSSIANT